jgi:hypothetical protein
MNARDFFVAALIGCCTVAYAEKQCTGDNRSHFIVLLDLSEPLDQPSNIAYKTLAKKIVAALPSEAKLSVYTIKPNAEDVNKNPDFGACVPNFNSMKGERFKARSQAKFEDYVLPQLEKLGESISPAKRSPILENIFKITHANFLRTSSGQNHTLVVISDLVQYSEIADFYHDIPDYNRLSLTGRFASWIPKANEVKLHLVLLNSPSARTVDQKKLREFWLAYSKSNYKQCGFSGLNQIASEYKNEC